MLAGLHRVITERILLVIVIVLLGGSGGVPHRLRVIVQEAALGTQLVVVVLDRVILVANHVVIESLVQLLDLVLFDLQNDFVFAVNFGYLLFYNLAAAVVVGGVSVESDLGEAAAPDGVLRDVGVHLVLGAGELLAQVGCLALDIHVALRLSLFVVSAGRRLRRLRNVVQLLV